jgi:TonB family protein
MRYVALVLAFSGFAHAQVEYEAEQLYRNAALHAFGNLSQLELNATITLNPQGRMPIPKMISIVMSRPGNFRLTSKMKTGTETVIVSKGKLWVESTYYHQNGTRAAELRSDGFPLGPAAREVVPRDLPLLTAHVAGREELSIEHQTFSTRKIDVTLRSHDSSGDVDIDSTLWIDEKSGIPLKQIERPRTAHGGSLEVIMTRFRTDVQAQADVFRARPTKGFTPSSAVFGGIAALSGGRPEVNFATSSGAPLRQVDLSGQPAILVFGGPGCKPCADEAREFEDASRRLKANGAGAVQVVWGSPDNSSGSEKTVFASSEQLGEFGIQVLPATVALAPDGRVAMIEQGFVTADEMVAFAEKARILPSMAQMMAGSYVFASQPGVVAPVLVHQAPVDRAAWMATGSKEGEVVLSAIVAKDGSVMRTNVVKSGGPELDAVAMEAVRQWTYKPGTRDGQAANVAVRVAIRFGLR